MKSIKFSLILAVLTGLAACDGSNQYVTRSDTTPFSFAPYVPINDDTASQRASIDLLSLS